MNVLVLIYPYLFAVFPVLFLYFHNVQRYPVPLSEVIVPLIIVVVGVFALQAAIRRAIKNQDKTSLLISVFCLLFFSFGSVSELFHSYDRSLSIAFLGLLFFSFSYLLLTTKNDLSYLSRTAAFIGIILVVLQPALYTLNAIGAYGYAPRKLSITDENSTSASEKPNIFYIILDGYARQDILKSLYDYDNEFFLSSLKQRGFFIAEKSRTNYNQTLQSIASSLNMHYLTALARSSDDPYRHEAPLYEAIRNNAVFSFVKKLGYTTIAYGSGLNGTTFTTTITNADISIAPSNALTEFQNLLINTTPIPTLLESVHLATQTGLFRNRVSYPLKHLADHAGDSGPQLIFSHIICPHPPFVFDENGNPVYMENFPCLADGSVCVITDKDRQIYYTGYRQQVTFISNAILKVIDDILQLSSTPPIIILQSDHGPGMQWIMNDVGATNLQERVPNFIALYLPGESTVRPYDTITPVNIFRLIFNRYFGTSYEMLDDRSYFATVKHPYTFIDVTDKIR
ncbi:MAG: hypothetical protein V1907_04355 [Candidatus Kerfeldbacteria bacterium]